MHEESVSQGFLIVFEGIDGTGKTTQANLLKKWLTKKKAQTIQIFKEPTTIPSEGMCKSWTPQEEYHFFLNDRKQNIQYNILPALNMNHIIILDRYFLSTMAYQGIKGISHQKILNDHLDIPWPKIIFVLTASNTQKLKQRIMQKEIVTLLQEIDYFQSSSQLEILKTECIKFISISKSITTNTQHQQSFQNIMHNFFITRKKSRLKPNIIQAKIPTLSFHLKFQKMSYLASVAKQFECIVPWLQNKHNATIITIDTTMLSTKETFMKIIRNVQKHCFIRETLS